MLKFSLQNLLQSCLKFYFWYGMKGCQYIVTQDNKYSICLLIDFGY